jgi:putative selenium metabolism protein SsnA
MSILLYNILIFTNDQKNTILKDHALAIEGNFIAELGPQEELKSKYSGLKQIDGKGRLLMPGLINTHMHFYGTFARGLALQKQPENFYQILKELWWKLDAALDLEAVYYSTLIPAINAIRHGVTTIIDHHASPNAIEGSLDYIENALSETGLRAVLCYEVSDRDGATVRQQGLEENSRYINKCKKQQNNSRTHLFDAMVGLHASFTLEDISLQKAAQLSSEKGCGCHIHLLEDAVDQQLTRKYYKNDVVKRLSEYGILGEKTIAAHGIYLEEPDMDLLSGSKTNVVHNPQSNMNNAVGCADIFNLMKRDITVGIGTDGMSASVIPDVRTANLLHKHDLKNSNSGWSEIQKMLFRNNPRIFERITGKKAGTIEKGYLADIILVDYFPPTPLNSDNFWGHFLYGIADAAVDTTIINGKIVMQHKEIIDLDEVEIAAKSQLCAERVWKKFSK